MLAINAAERIVMTIYIYGIPKYGLNSSYDT